MLAVRCKALLQDVVEKTSRMQNRKSRSWSYCPSGEGTIVPNSIGPFNPHPLRGLLIYHDQSGRWTLEMQLIEPKYLPAGQTHAKAQDTSVSCKQLSFSTLGITSKQTKAHEV